MLRRGARELRIVPPNRDRRTVLLRVKRAVVVVVVVVGVVVVVFPAHGCAGPVELPYQGSKRVIVTVPISSASAMCSRA